MIYCYSILIPNVLNWSHDTQFLFNLRIELELHFYWFIEFIFNKTDYNKFNAKFLMDSQNNPRARRLIGIQGSSYKFITIRLIIMNFSWFIFTKLQTNVANDLLSKYFFRVIAFELNWQKIIFPKNFSIKFV